jgi:hypothetical protein
MKFCRFNHLIALTAFAAATTSARATTVDFQVEESCYEAICTNVQGYNFSFNAGGWAVTNDHNSYFNPNPSGGFLGARGSLAAQVTMTRFDGGTFDLASLDAATHHANFLGGASLVLTGSLVGGETVTQTLLISKDWNNYVLSGFQNLTQLVFEAPLTDVGFEIDNLRSVPEPGTLSLVGLAAAAIAVTCRRRST